MDVSAELGIIVIQEQVVRFGNSSWASFKARRFNFNLLIRELEILQ